MANVECHTKKGCTPFHLACKEGHLQISQQLYEKGADTEVKQIKFSINLELPVLVEKNWETNKRVCGKVLENCLVPGSK